MKKKITVIIGFCIIAFTSYSQSFNQMWFNLYGLNSPPLGAKEKTII